MVMYPIIKYSDDKEPTRYCWTSYFKYYKVSSLEDVMVVVTRYFEVELLLGTGGLTRAYSKASKEAIEDSIMGSRIEATVLILKCPMSLMENFHII